ncbi:HEAT repeat domain-containing protein [uncultured Nonlabens sp.]|uniref:HEAT repeat domain-containing protein n=1 Tax=uncultured Nonlabens sp. TaxID=859306 RepID=UPI0026174E46|nr:HEAT repeat domain-containing protein [uncultured Nonlabens sp.]
MTESNHYKNTIEKELLYFLNSQEFSFSSIFDKIYGYRSSDYTDDYYDFKEFKKNQSDIYFNNAIEKYEKNLQPSLKQEIKEIALKDLYRRYDVLVRLEDRDCFDIVLKNAEDFLKGEDYLYDHGNQYESGQVLFDLIEAYYIPTYKEEVVTFFHQAFNFAKKYSKENKKWDYLSGDPDGTTLLIIAQAIASLKNEDREQFWDRIVDIYTFSANDKASYEMNQASGYIALLLTLFDKIINLDILENAINITGKHYRNNTFVHQTLYCKWMLTNDINGALFYIKSEENRKGLVFAIITLADLNHKEALPTLESGLKDEKDPILIEVYKEAIKRLKTQGTIPEKENRMIWLNGNFTPTQRALGAKSDNIFVEKAQEKIGLDNNVYETDDD